MDISNSNSSARGPMISHECPKEMEYSGPHDQRGEARKWMEKGHFIMQVITGAMRCDGHLDEIQRVGHLTLSLIYLRKRNYPSKGRRESFGKICDTLALVMD